MDTVVLNDLIDTTSDAREVKRGIAVKLRKMGHAISEVAEALNVSAGYVVKWTGVYKKEGANGLRLKYKGSKGYLNDLQKKEITDRLKGKAFWDLTELHGHLEQSHGVIFKSKQSYYDLFKAAGISWKKTQKTNPKKDPVVVATRQEELKKKFIGWRQDFLTERLVLFFIDECRLLWGDVCGYVWGRADQRIDIPVTNEKQRQTYYGALNYATGRMLLQAYPKGDSGNTVEFMKYSVEQCPGQRIAVIWDGASYHKFGKMPEFLTEINRDLPENKWKITCLLFAPNAPEQNPVEDIWLKGKNFIRAHYYLCSSFKRMKDLFVDTLHQQVFNFPKLVHYRQFLQLI